MSWTSPSQSTFHTLRELQTSWTPPPAIAMFLWARLDIEPWKNGDFLGTRQALPMPPKGTESLREFVGNELGIVLSNANGSSVYHKNILLLDSEVQHNLFGGHAPDKLPTIQRELEALSDDNRALRGYLLRNFWINVGIRSIVNKEWELTGVRDPQGTNARKNGLYIWGSAPNVNGSYPVLCFKQVSAQESVRTRYVVKKVWRAEINDWPKDEGVMCILN